MQKTIKKELAHIVGNNRALTGPEDLIAYSYDAYTVEAAPDIVLFPIATEEIADILKVASYYGVPVTARGSATNIAGQSVPVKGGVVVAFSLMDRILLLDPGGLRAIVQPGVINRDLQIEAAKNGLMYPPDPASLAVATIGGNVATNAGGPRTVKYGVTRDYLIGLKAITATGEVLELRRNRPLRSNGYEILDLVCGSEGTLALISEVETRLIPKPESSRTLRAGFPSLEQCGTAVSEIMACGVTPAALELMDNGIVNAVESVASMGLPTDLEGVLLIEIDGEEESLEYQLNIIKDKLTKAGAKNILAASNEQEAEQIWMARRMAFSAMASLRPNSTTEDATTPVTQLGVMIGKIRKIATRHDLHIGVLAHAGDGNLHPLILFDVRDPEEVKRVEAAAIDIFHEALAVGGVLTGEHGIGLAKSRFIDLQLDGTALEVTRAIKSAFDPKGILNPGKFI